MDRRTFLKALTAAGFGAVTVGALAGCAPESAPALAASPSTKPELSADIAFALFPGYLALMKKHAFDPYLAENPKVNLSPLEGPASQTYAQLLASPPNARSIQGGMMNDALSWAGVKDGLWDKVTTKQAPNINKIPEKLRNDAGTPWVFNGFGISYNPEKLPNGLDSWKDLYSPSLKGKVAMWPAYFDAYLMAAVAAGADSTEVEKGIEEWKKAKDNIGMWITSVADLHQAMDRGEIWAAPDYLSTAVRDAKAGMKLAMALPSEGAVLNTYQLESVLGNSADQKQAMADLINLSLGDATQQAAFEQSYLTPANGDVKVDASKGDIPGLDGYKFTASDAVDRFYKVDYKWVGENTAKIKKLIEDNLN
jgi:putative spermidine/putrescine transport system substrate-binding protein